MDFQFGFSILIKLFIPHLLFGSLKVLLILSFKLTDQQRFIGF